VHEKEMMLMKKIDVLLSNGSLMKARLVLHTGKRVRNLISVRKMTSMTNQKPTIMETTKLLSLTLKVKVIHYL